MLNGPIPAEKPVVEMLMVQAHADEGGFDSLAVH